MKRTYIKDLKDGECLVKGYIENIRDKKLIFIILRDVTGFVQITVNKDDCPEIYAAAKALTVHSFISVEGKCVFSDFVKNGGKEIYPTKLTVESIAETLPIDDTTTSPELKMDYQWISLRDPKKVLCFRIQTAFERYAVEYFNQNGFIEIHTPKLTTISSEGGSEVFYLKNPEWAHWWDKPVALTQSPQLYKQMSMAAGFDKTFEIGEYFRANQSNTNRHDLEFTCIDVEISHIDGCGDVMDCEEELLKYVISKVSAEFSDEYRAAFGRDVPTVSDAKFPRIPLLEVYNILKSEMNYEVPRELKGDLDPEGERLISKYVQEKFGCDFVFVTDFPIKARAFYTMKKSGNPELGECYDLIYRGNEITSGAQREHRYDRLKERMVEGGVDPEKMTQYLDFFRYGAPTHGGFGLGITRVLAKLFDLPSVKDVTFLFRGPNRLEP
jgi:aspartyl-tRNA synthetase